jgi:hypothetical protein
MGGGAEGGSLYRKRIVSMRLAIGTDGESSRCERWACAVVAAIVAWHLGFVLVGCRWDLSGDEAFYWDWSRHLDWGYAMKGPLVAWLIRLSTELVGGLSVRWTGTLMPAVRLPAVLLGACSAWGVFRLGARVVGRARVGLWAMLLMPVVPIFVFDGLIMTDDVPFVCCWVWAAVWTHAALQNGSLRAWICAGLVSFLGVLSKYTMLAFPISVGLFLLISRKHRGQLAGPGFWVLALLCASGMVPIVAWNVTHEWVAMRHLAGRVGLTNASWSGLATTLRFLGCEAAVLGGLWWLIGLGALASAVWSAFKPLQRVAEYREATETPCTPLLDEREGLRYLICLWVVIWLACLAASLRGVTQPTWMAPAYFSVLVLIGWQFERALRAGGGGRRAAVRWVCVGFWVLSAGCVLAVGHTEWFYPVASRWLPRPTPEHLSQIRRFDPTCRLRGSRAMAEEIDSRLAALRARGEEPFLLTAEYGMASLLSFYLPGQPEVSCLGGAAGVTAAVGAQHDLWRPNPRLDPDVYRRRPALVLAPAGASPSFGEWLAQIGLFSAAEAPNHVVAVEEGVPVAAWNVTTCYDYRGLAAVDELLNTARSLASAEFYAAHGATPAGYIEGLFRAVLGRSANPLEVQFYAGMLRKLNRVKVAETVLTCEESRRRAQASGRSFPLVTTPPERPAMAISEIRDQLRR